MGQNTQWFRKTWGLFLALLPTGCVTMDKLLSHSKSQLLLKWGQSLYHRIVTSEWKFALAQKSTQSTRTSNNVFFPEMRLPNYDYWVFSDLFIFPVSAFMLVKKKDQIKLINFGTQLSAFNSDKWTI